MYSFIYLFSIIPGSGHICSAAASLANPDEQSTLTALQHNRCLSDCPRVFPADRLTDRLSSWLSGSSSADFGFRPCLSVLGLRWDDVLVSVQSENMRNPQGSTDLNITQWPLGERRRFARRIYVVLMRNAACWKFLTFGVSLGSTHSVICIVMD